MTTEEKLNVFCMEAEIDLSDIERIIVALGRWKFRSECERRELIHAALQRTKL